METPLKFQAPSLTLPVALEIGHLVFHALNALEIGYASAITAITLLNDWPRRIRALTLLIAVLLAMQTILLYTVLGRPHSGYHPRIRGAGAVLPPVLHCTRTTLHWKASSWRSCSTWPVCSSKSTTSGSARPPRMRLKRPETEPGPITHHALGPRQTRHLPLWIPVDTCGNPRKPVETCGNLGIP